MKNIRTEAARKGREYLIKAQRKNGGWAGYTSPDKDLLERELSGNVFNTALILLAVSEIKDAELERAKARAAKYLLGQKSGQWTFNYWERNSSAAKALPYPDDLDDTSVALAALRQYKKELVPPEALSKFVQVLTMLEVKPGGPYRTWLVSVDSKKEWRDVDVAVNANIAYFLSLYDVSLPGSGAFLKRSILSNKLSSPYYPSSLQVMYFLCRTAGNDELRAMAKRIKGLKLTSTLEQALAAIIFLRAGKRKEGSALLGKVLRVQKKDGSFAPAAFCIDPARKGRRYYAGSAALTTVIALEALEIYERTEAALKMQDPAADRYYAKAFKEVEGMLGVYAGPLELKRDWLRLAAHIRTRDKGQQVVLAPYLFYKFLSAKKKIGEKNILELGQISLLGWMAYTELDDIMDGEKDGGGIPVAVAALREMGTKLADLFSKDKEARGSFREILRRMDAANAWELSACRIERSGGKLKAGRLPVFGSAEKLAGRSIGHAIAPLGVVVLRGYRPGSEAFKRTLSFFENYLAARQLNDDAHDWLSDLKNGRVNSASAGLLRRFSRDRERGSIDIERDREILEESFWRVEMPLLGKEIEKYCRKAEAALRRMPLKDARFLEHLILEIRSAAKNAVSGSSEAFRFIDSYKG